MKVINLSHFWKEVNQSHARKRQMVKAGVSPADVKLYIDAHNAVTEYFAKKNGYRFTA